MSKKTPEEMWREILTAQNPILRGGRRILGMIPASQRCKNCHAPFTGVGSVLMRFAGRARYERNPRFCNF